MSGALLGIDIGGTNIKAVRIENDAVVAERTEASPSEDREELAASVRALVKEMGDGAICGVASPGLAAPDMRSILWMRGRMEALEGLDWTDALGRDARVLNDAHAAALGEAWLGAGRGVQNMLLLTLGTGVGGGVIVNGELVTGSEGKAGHLGHMCLDPEGPPDIVNTPGSLEDLVGDHTVGARSGGRFASTAEVAEAAARGDAVACEVWERMTYHLACALTSLINCFDPERIVLGGGIVQAGDALMAPLAAHLDHLEWRPTGKKTELVRAALGPFSGAIGAARFAMLHAERT